MIDLLHANLIALPGKIGRPWHGLVRNAVDGQSATLTLGNGSTRPWPTPISSNNSWLLQRPVATARLCLDVHAGTPGTFPPADAPDWPLTSAAESAQGMRYLDHAIGPHGTGAGAFPIVFAADGTPWVIGANPITYVDAGTTAVWSLDGWPYGRIGRAPAAGLPLTPTISGADRLPLAPYSPDSSVILDAPLQMALDYGALAISSDGKRWLLRVSASDHVALEPPVSCVLGLYEIVFSGGNATTPPTFRLVHVMGWQEAMGLEVMVPDPYSWARTGRVVHAWYTASDEVETVTLDRTADDGGYYGRETFLLWAGNRQIAQAVIVRGAGDSTLNGEPIPGLVFSGGGGGGGVVGEQLSPNDIRLRHHYTSTLVSGDPDHRFVLTPRLLSNQVIGLYAATALVGSAVIDWSRWIGAGTPSGVDPATLTDNGTVAIIPAPPACPNCKPYARYSPAHPHGTWHPKTHQLIRNQSEPVAFV